MRQVQKLVNMIVLNSSGNTGNLPKYYVNVNHITCYYKNENGTTYVCLLNGGHVECIDTPEQIEKYINEVNSNG